MGNFKHSIYLTVILSSLFASVALIYSCEKEQNLIVRETSTSEAIESAQRNQEEARICGEILLKKLITDKNETVGQAFIYNNSEHLFIEIISSKEYYLTDTYMQIAYEFSHIPLDHYLNPNIEVFANILTDNEPSKFRSYKIPLDKIYSRNYIITIACKVQEDFERPGSEQLAWVDGISYGNNVKGRYFNYRENYCEVNGKETSISEN